MKKVLNIIRHQKMQIRTAWSFQINPDRMAAIEKTVTNAGENVENRELLYATGRNTNWSSNHGTQYSVFS